jgi:hypothetical protein
MKIVKWIAIAVMFIGFMFILGTAGASDLDLIGWRELLTRCLCGLGLMGVGFMTAYIIEQKENA